jgi:glycosyltransferase involved in cell wall biosynthesis
MTSQPPSLAYLCSDPGIAPDGVKGASVHFRELGLALRSAGVELDAFMARPGSAAAPSFPVTVVPCARRGEGIEAELRLLGMQERLLDALQQKGPHAAVYERFSLFGLTGLAYARSLGIPLVLEINAPLWLEAERYRSLALREAARAAAREVLCRADHVLVVSEALRAVVCDEGVEPQRVRVFHNGVAWDAFERALPAKRPPALEGRPVLVFVGSLKPWHGIEMLLEAAAAATARRPLGLWIVGDGPLRPAVERAARAHPDWIVAEGAVPHARIPSILKAADIALAPYPKSSPDYFCPLKVAEALAAGCCLLASDTAPVRELVGSPPLAALHAPDDVESFVEALERLLDAPGQRQQMARDGARYAARELTWARRAAEIQALLGWGPALAELGAAAEAGR